MKFMNAVMVEIIDESGMRELANLETKRLIKFLPSENQVELPSKRFWGKISTETANKLTKDVDKSRKEWDLF
jgi:hypothetical protein